MPGRQVRRLLRHHLIPSEDSESESSSSHAPPSNNLFHILNLDEQVDEVEHTEEIRDGNTDNNGRSWTTANIRPQKSKNKKKSKKKDGHFSEEIGKDIGVDMEGLSHCDISGEEQLDPPGNEKDKQDGTMLWIDPKYLNASKEMKKIFGASAVKYVENERASSSRSTHGRRRDRYMHKKTFLVSPCDHWPPLTGLLSMDLIETKQGYNYFRYVYPLSYNEAQREFEAAKDSHILNNIANVLRNNPYHLDSLLTMADYFRFTGEHDMASEAISKCLYALERAWHPKFTPFRSNSLLQFTHETNRPLFTTLFAHMKSLSKLGCHRSALELCKLILSLDPADPMGALLCIDYYSLRAHQYSWFEKFATYYGNNNTSLCVFPNFLFSLAACRLYTESAGTIPGDPKKEGSVDMMKRALLVHPTVLSRLVGRVPLKEEVWKNVAGSGFFRQEWTGSVTVDHLVSIYIERSHGLWRLPELQKLLEEGAFLVTEELKTNGTGDARNWARVREEAFSSEENGYGHLLVSDFSDTEPRMPPENLQSFRGDGEGGNGEETDRGLLTAIFESMFAWVRNE